MTAGDDRSASLGSSLNSSFSLFANIRGNDTYKPTGRAFGHALSRASGERAQFGSTVGIFIDIGGNDSYNMENAGNDTRWYPVPADRAAGLYSIGIDAPEGALRFERE